MNSIDIGYIWQRRVQHGFRYQKGEVPFPDLAKIGVDFNVVSKRKEKVDLSLLTNGVIFDFSAFAKAVNKAGRYFLFEILEFNFDLGTYNEQERDSFASRIYIRAAQVKLRKKPMKRKQIFVLPEQKPLTDVCLSEIPEKSQCFPSSSYGDFSLPPPQEVQIDSSKALNGEVKVTQLESRDCIPKTKKEPYPLCKKIGLDLYIRPNDTAKEKLDLNLLTKGVMLELLKFTKVLCGSHNSMVFDLLEHNFELNLNRSHARLQVVQIFTERRASGFPPHLRAAFRQEPFIFQTKKSGSKWKKRWPVEVDDQSFGTVSEETIMKKRRIKPKNKFSSIDDIFYSHSSPPTLEHSELPNHELSYLCPVEPEKEMLSSSGIGQENKMNSNYALETTAVGLPSLLGVVKEEEEEMTISPSMSLSESSLGPPNAPISSREALEATSTLVSEDVKVEMEKLRVWRRRAVRSKKILSGCRGIGNFNHCKTIFLDFNVGFGVKQNINPKLLTNGILFEVSQFARAMRRTQNGYLFEVLNNNFRLNIQNEQHRRTFLLYITTKVRYLPDHNLQNMEFLNESIELPEIYNMVDVTCDLAPPQDDLIEKQADCEPPLAVENDQQDGMDAYPFCKKIGLNLWSMEDLPQKKKLDFSCLTNGALIEAVSFTQKLCGNTWDIIVDILEHNFDLNLPGGKTNVLLYIRRWYTKQKYLKAKKPCFSKLHGLEKWFNTHIQLESYLSETSVCAPAIKDESPSEMDCNRAALSTAEQQMPKTECGDYPLCKELGLQLDICSRSEVKAKLDRQLLTRAVVYEIHKFVKESCGTYIHALYRILEHNFDLHLQNHQRWDFALSVASQVIAMVGKFKRHLSNKGDYPNQVFELPFEVTASGQSVFKEEPEDVVSGADPEDGDDVLFVRTLLPVDIEVELE